MFQIQSKNTASLHRVKLTLVTMMAVPMSEPPTILTPHGVLGEVRRSVTPKTWGFLPPPAALIVELAQRILVKSHAKSRS